MKRIALIMGLGAALASCVESGRPAAVSTLPVALSGGVLDRVVGQDAAGLTRMFGPPDADMREGPARKLQFTSRICVLDAYLYPKGKAEPRVTWLDAREPDGSAIDRASCVAALERREGAR